MGRGFSTQSVQFSAEILIIKGVDGLGCLPLLGKRSTCESLGNFHFDHSRSLNDKGQCLYCLKLTEVF